MAPGQKQQPTTISVLAAIVFFPACADASEGRSLLGHRGIAVLETNNHTWVSPWAVSCTTDVNCFTADFHSPMCVDGQCSRGPPFFFARVGACKCGATHMGYTNDCDKANVSTHYSAKECHEKCAADKRCSGYDVEISGRSLRCTVYHTRRSLNPLNNFEIYPLEGNGAYGFACYSKQDNEKSECRENDKCAELDGPFCCPTEEGVQLYCCDEKSFWARSYWFLICIGILVILLAIVSFCLCHIMRGRLPDRLQTHDNGLAGTFCTPVPRKMSKEDLGNAYIVLLGNPGSGSGDCNFVFDNFALHMPDGPGEKEKYEGDHGICGRVLAEKPYDEIVKKIKEEEKSVRVFACGGDGTVTWVLKELYDDKGSLAKAFLRSKHADCTQATVTFNGGEMGIIYNDKGIVQETKIFDSPAGKQEITKGSRILKVESEKYSKQAVVDAENRGTSYKITFLVEDEKLRDVMQKIKKERRPPLGIVPLGTGNDTARSLGWGAAKLPTQSLEDYIKMIVNASEVDLDQWQLTMTPHSFLPPALGPQQELQHDGLFQNYFSVGLDARITYGVGEARSTSVGRWCFRQRPPCCPKLHGGLLCYGLNAPLPRPRCKWFCGCAKENLMGPDVQNPVLKVSYKNREDEDWKEFESPNPVQQFTLTNINSYGAGMKLYKPERYHPHPDATVTPFDKRIEAFTLKNDNDLVYMSMCNKFLLCLSRIFGCGKYEPVFSAKHIKISMNKRTFYQMDGEPWTLPDGADMEVHWKRTVKMMLPPAGERRGCCPIRCRSPHVWGDGPPAGIWNSNATHDFWHSEQPGA